MVIPDLDNWMVAIHRLARRFAGSRDDIKDDLVGEMYLALVESLQNYPDQKAGFYYRCITRRAIDFRKSKRCNYSYKNRVPHISLEAMDDAGFQITTTGEVIYPGNRKMWLKHFFTD